MSRPAFALILSGLLALSAGPGRALAADLSATSVFLLGMNEVCVRWQDGAEQKALYRSLKTLGWTVDLLPKMDGPWGSAQFQPSRLANDKRGCSAMVALSGAGEKAAVTKAALDWVARRYPKLPMTNQNKPLQIKAGPVHAWSWVDDKTIITFIVADTVSEATRPHVVLSIKAR